MRLLDGFIMFLFQLPDTFCLLLQLQITVLIFLAQRFKFLFKAAAALPGLQDLLLQIPDLHLVITTRLLQLGSPSPLLLKLALQQQQLFARTLQQAGRFLTQRNKFTFQPRFLLCQIIQRLLQFIPRCGGILQLFSMS